MSSQPVKRRLENLFFSASKKDAKTRKLDSEKERGDKPGEVTMLEREEGVEPLADMSTITESVSVRVKEALATLSGDSEVARVLMQLVPTLATAVSIAVGEVMGSMLVKLEERLEEKLKPSRAAVSDAGLETVVRRLTYDNDRLEQYTRRESARIFGIRQQAGETAEDVETKTLKVIRDAGVEVKPEDIAAVHRAGRSKDGSRPILVKFVSRRKRRELMIKKKALKNVQGYERVFIGDDLTPLRARLLGYVKKLPNVEKAWVVEGRIHAQRRFPTGLPPEDRPRPVTIESPDDLFKLGVSSVDYAALGLPHLAFGEVASGGV